MRKFFLFHLAFLLLSVTSTHALSQQSNYLLGDGDVIKLTVYDHADLSTTGRINADGTLMLPLIGKISISGLTISQTTEEIARQLADGYIISPQVSVFVEEFRSQKTVIMGQVTKPGLFELSGKVTLLELVSKAGGMTKDAGDRAIIKRRIEEQGEEKVLTIDLKRLIEEGDTSLNVQILDGDSVYISKAGLFYITGEVRKPDAYKYEEGSTIIKVISKAGGFTDKAAKGKVRLIRKIDGVEQVSENADMHEPVLPDDVIVIPESFF